MNKEKNIIDSLVFEITRTDKVLGYVYNGKITDNKDNLPVQIIKDYLKLRNSSRDFSSNSADNYSDELDWENKRDGKKGRWLRITLYDRQPVEKGSPNQTSDNKFCTNCFTSENWADIGANLLLSLMMNAGLKEFRSEKGDYIAYQTADSIPAMLQTLKDCITRGFTTHRKPQTTNSLKGKIGAKITEQSLYYMTLDSADHPIVKQGTIINQVSTKDLSFIDELARHGWRIHHRRPDAIGSYPKQDNIVAAVFIQQEILTQALKLPLYDYYYSNKDYYEFVQLLIASTDIVFDTKNTTSGTGFQYKIDVTVHPLVSSFCASFETKYSPPGSGYTCMDVLNLFGKYAISESARTKEHKFTLDENDRNQYGEMLVKLIRANNSKRSDSEFILRYTGNAANNNEVKFISKPIRLIIDGMYSAMQDITAFTVPAVGGSKTEPPSYEKMTESIINYSCDDDLNNEKSGLTHTEYHFDNLVIYVSAYLRTLPFPMREQIIRELIRYADNFDVSQRKKQEMAIACLVSALIEHIPVCSETRRCMLEATFGKSMYEDQQKVWKHLAADPYYEDYIKRYFREAVTLCIVNNTLLAQKQPLFLFTFGYLPRKNDPDWEFTRTAGRLQRQTWFGQFDARNVFYEYEDSRNSNLTFIQPKINEFLSHVQEFEKTDCAMKPNSKFLYYLLGMQLVTYALANIGNMALSNGHDNTGTGSSEKMCSIISAAESDPNCLRAVILCDYYTRKLNPLYYDKGYSVLSQKQLWLLCGPYRFVCSIRHTSCVNLTGYQIADYVKWLGSEEGRYRVLLYRLLSYTNVPSEACVRMPDTMPQHLPYDHLPDEMKDFLNDPKKLF